MLDSIKKWLDEFSENIKSRYNDAFLFYLITFEIIFNWKFLYSLIISNSEKSENVINAAEAYLVKPWYAEWIFQKLWEPTPFTQAIISSLIMTIAYPYISICIQILRKRSIYYYNSVLEKDYPTREDYKDLQQNYSVTTENLNIQKRQNVQDLYNLSQGIQDLLPGKAKRNGEKFVVGVSSGGQVFSVDEVVTVNRDNRIYIEKLQPGSTNLLDLYIIHKIISRNLFIMTSINDSVLVSNEFKNSGKAYLFIHEDGTPKYLETNELESYKDFKSILLTQKRNAEDKELTFLRNS